MLKVSGTCLISKDFNTKMPDFQIAQTSNGNRILKGRLYWQDSGTDKEGKKTSSEIKFVAYKEMVDFISSNHDKVLELKDCPLKKISWKNSEGKWQSFYEITVFNAQIYQKKETKPFSEPKDPENNFNPDIDDESIPF